MVGILAVSIIVSILIIGGYGISQQASAFPVGIGGAVDTPACDTLDMPSGTYEELGTVHPTDELISAVDLGSTSLVACPATNGGSSPNVLVSMTNLTPHTWGDVWYFGDSGTALLNNADGVDSGINLIFKIDSVGVNTPLMSESIITDDKWQPGETWEFVIQGYSGIPGTAAEFSSLFVGAGSAAGPSTGSIVALIGEPTTTGSSQAIGQTTILGTCGLSFPDGNSVNYGAIIPNSISSEIGLNVTNSGSVSALLEIRGTDWKDGSNNSIMNVNQTHFNQTSFQNTFAQKALLNGTDGTVTSSFVPSELVTLFLQLEAILLDPFFTGSATQTMDFTVSC